VLEEHGGKRNKAGAALNIQEIVASLTLYYPKRIAKIRLADRIIED